MNPHILIDIVFVITMIIIIIIFHYKSLIYKRNSNELIKILSKNVDFLNIFYRKQELIQLKNSIQLYSQFQVILKISKANYISFFKYDYSNKFVVLHFLLSVNDKGVILQDSHLEDLPVASSLVTLNIMKSDNNELYSILVDEVKDKDETVYNVMKRRGVNKMYYQNIYKEEKNPLGYIAISYKDENFMLPEDDKIEIIRILEKIKTYL